MAESHTVTLKDRTITVTRQDLAMFRELYLGTSERKLFGERSLCSISTANIS
jgi:hypothetical protein